MVQEVLVDMTMYNAYILYKENIGANGLFMNYMQFACEIIQVNLIIDVYCVQQTTTEHCSIMNNCS